MGFARFLSHLLVAAIAFTIGLVVGIREGWVQYPLVGGLVHAEMARQELSQLRDGNTEFSIGLQEGELRTGLERFYDYRNYRWKFLLPAEVRIFDYSKIEPTLMNRIIQYVDTYPESMSSSWTPEMVDELIDPFIKEKPEDTDFYLREKQETLTFFEEGSRKRNAILEEYRAPNSHLSTAE